MTSLLMAEIPKYQFKSVQLLKDQSLGIGSYGAVYKAKCDDLLCAAKIIHPTLFDPTGLQQVALQREHRLPIRRFEQECEFMSAIRHPNIVQYLGMFRDTETHLPMLLMELMDDSLTHFLESSTQPISYHIQVNICHDVTLALSFLHSNKIVHRDLSSNNVLLIGNTKAKVTDFGMVRLGDINPQATRFTSTMCPGTDVYMPPEAVQDKPVYTEKIDCFSFGVIIVQILTRKFPSPGDRLQEIELNHPGIRAGTVLVRIPEVERRQNHIGQADPNNSLLPIALDCLKDKDGERPSAHQLCERVAALKRMPKYRDSASLRAVEDSRDEVIRSLTIRMNHTISVKQEENQQLRRQLQQERDRANRQSHVEERVRQQLRESDQTLTECRKQLQEKERQFGHVNQQLEARKQVVARLERRIAELEQQLSQKEQPKAKPSSGAKELASFQLRWREGKRAPWKWYRASDAVVDGSMVYIQPGRSNSKIYSYDVTSDSWSLLPDCVHENGSIAVINGCLTTVGGGSYPYYSNELFSLTGKGSIRRWTKKFSPMPTKRSWTTSLCIGITLIVAGGMGVRGTVLSTVEMLNTESHQWSTAANLPQPMFCASATVFGDQVYLLGGISKNLTSPRSVYTCSVSTLLQDYPRYSRYSHKVYISIWEQVADLPVTQSTCESFHGRLLVIGGRTKDSGRHTTAVHMYNSTTNSWEIISHMTTGRYECFTAVLPDNRLMVVGGRTDGVSDLTDSVELASMY